MLGFVLPPSWSRYATKLASLFNNVDVSVLTAFWLFGLINNLLYVILLSAAQDLVGSSTPKSLVLLADVLPSFLIKLFAPYAIHLVPYYSRIIVFVMLSSMGMLLVALAPQASIPLKLLGVILASISSGGGELTFLGLTHHYGGLALAAWGSGTGGAGLAGAGYYVLFTSVLKLSVGATLLTSATLPLVMLFTYAVVLPRGLIMNSNKDMAAVTGAEEYTRLPSTNNGEDDDSTSIEDQDGDDDDILPDAATASLIPRTDATTTSSQLSNHMLRQNLRRAKSLFVPYMLPLFLVYVSEYLINQGISPTLLFPINASPFDEMRSFYPFYGFLYQLGVFISRSSMPFVRIHHLYLPSFLQVFNLVVLAAQALFDFIPTVYIVFIIIFWEGLLGGAVYVNTFAEIMENVPPSEREFSLSATSVSDSAGICTAGFLGLVVEVWLCNWQVRHGRDWCKKVDVGE